MPSVQELIQHIETAFENAEKGVSKITEGILQIDGMSGKKTRHFYNNLLNKEDSRYLEIGTWKGSSVCSAMCGNKAKVVAIDNFSEANGPRDLFHQNFNTFKGENDARFIEADCFTVDASTLPKFNIYMYDGNHTKDSHYRALTHFYNCLDDVFIFIVDDWNWRDVREGTYDAIRNLNMKILYEREIRMTQDESHTPLQEALDTWWNGIWIGILKKPGPPKRYTQNWFDPVNLVNALKEFENRDNLKFLEIGSFEGQSTNYFVNTYLKGKDSSITCIDPWIKYSESTVTKMNRWDNEINESTYDIFMNNIYENSEKIIVKRGLSKEIVPTLTEQYDFIFVDGDHSEEAVWYDAILSFEKLKVGGIMIFDDYEWSVGNTAWEPRNAVNRFVQEYGNKIEVLFKNYQYGIRKTSN